MIALAVKGSSFGKSLLSLRVYESYLLTFFNKDRIDDNLVMAVVIT